ncbi:MAG: hypothetical protein IJV05_09180 [Muribaculaceae bacterium]|nr:hypothetical protein [Muribaculaceae bacterium]
MKNEEKIELEARGNEPVTPPPFRQSEEHAAEQEPPASPSLAERIAAMGMDEPMTQRLVRLTEGLDSAAATDELLSTIARGIAHDDDVKNADAAGYLRGRNEKIEAVLHPQADDEQPEATPVFPRYCRRSVWD